MRLGVSFGELVTAVRAELRRSSALAHGIADVDHIKRAINAEYARLYDDYDWQHLRRVFPREPMVAGEQFYDPPDDLAIERVERVVAWWNNLPHEVPFGIGIAEYAQFDSVADYRSDPVLRWDIRWPDGQSATMYEVWPLPASANCSIEFTGLIKAPELVNDADVCLLDSECVILAAARKLADKDDRQTAEIAYQTRLRQIRGRQSAGRIQIGLGRPGTTPSGRAVVRISG